MCLGIAKTLDYIIPIHQLEFVLLKARPSFSLKNEPSWNVFRTPAAPLTAPLTAPLAAPLPSKTHLSQHLSQHPCPQKLLSLRRVPLPRTAPQVSAFLDAPLAALPWESPAAEGCLQTAVIIDPHIDPPWQSGMNGTARLRKLRTLSVLMRKGRDFLKSAEHSLLPFLGSMGYCTLVVAPGAAVPQNASLIIRVSSGKPWVQPLPPHAAIIEFVSDDYLARELQRGGAQQVRQRATQALEASAHGQRSSPSSRASNRAHIIHFCTPTQPSAEHGFFAPRLVTKVEGLAERCVVHEEYMVAIVRMATAYLFPESNAAMIFRKYRALPVPELAPCKNTSCSSSNVTYVGYG